MNDLRARLGARIREFRRARRMTQETLGEKAGLSYKFIGEIERGQGNPTVDTLQALCRALGVDVAELFNLAESASALGEFYAVPVRELQRVREALTSLESVFRDLGVTYRGRRPRPRRPRR